MFVGTRGWLWAMAALSLLCGGCGINRTIGGPGEYWSAGSGAMTGYVAVLVLLFLAVVFLIARYSKTSSADWDYDLDTEEADAAAVGFTVFCGGAIVAAIVVMQFLPVATSGIALLPEAPWNYVTTGGATLAWFAWIFLGFFVLLFLGTIGNFEEEGADLARAAFGNLVIGMIFTFCTSFCTVSDSIAAPGPGTPPEIMPAELADIDAEALKKVPAEHIDRLKKWLTEKEGIASATGRFKVRKDKVVSQLRELGITAASKTKGNVKASVLVDELKELASQLGLLERKLEAYEGAVIRQASVVRRIASRAELEQLAGITEQDLEDLDTAKLELDSKLEEAGKATAVSIIEVDELLKKELGQ